MHQPPYYTNYSKLRLVIHNVVTSKYFDLAIAGVIGLNVVTMAMEFYLMPRVSSAVLGENNIENKIEYEYGCLKFLESITYD